MIWIQKVTKQPRRKIASTLIIKRLTVHCGVSIVTLPIPCGMHIVILLVPYGVHIVILPVPCGVPVVVGVVEPAVVEVAAEVAGACSVAVGVVGATRAVGVDGVVLNEQQTTLLDKKILNDILNIKSVHIRFYLPE